MVRILLPTGSHVPEPRLAVEDAEPVAEHHRVEDEPPAALAELGQGGGHVGSPSVSEPSLHLQNISRVSGECNNRGTEPEFLRDPTFETAGRPRLLIISVLI